MVGEMTLDSSQEEEFRRINRAFGSVYRPGKLSIGLVVPLEAYPGGPVPHMDRHLSRAQLAERLGFAALWLRDVPFNVPSFGDAGQVFDPFTYLGFLAGQTKRIALGVASVILPLRHPAHVAKAAASADVLSDGRLLLGIASGDRPDEYPAMNIDYASRAERFRHSVDYIRNVATPYASFVSEHGAPDGIDLLPKPHGGRLPLLVTGGSRQHPDWVAQHGDGWITYPRNVPAQEQAVQDYRARLAGLGEPDKPVTQSLYIDVVDDENCAPQPIHLGFRAGIKALLAHLKGLEAAGINHVALNLRLNRADTEATMKRLAEHVLPAFSNGA